MRFFAWLLLLLFAGMQLHAQNDAGKLLARLKATQTDTGKIERYNDIFHYYQFSNPDSAIYYVESGLQEFTAKKYSNGIAAMTTLLAFEDVGQGRRDLARKRYATALALFTEINNRRGIATVNNGIGVLDGRTGNYESATKHFMIALKEFGQLNDVDGIVNTYLKLGTVNQQSNNLDKALEYYNKAIAQVERNSVHGTELIYLYNNAGIVYARKGDMQKGLDFFEMALKGSGDKPGFMEVKVLSLTNLGIVYDKMGNDKKSLYYFDEALRITRDKNMPEHYARLCVNRAAVLKKTNIPEAIATLNEASELARKIGQRSLLAEICEQQVEIYQHQKDYKAAFLTLRQQKNLEDSILNVDKAKEIANLQSVYELEQSNAKVNALEVTGKKDVMKRNVIISVAAGLALSLILLTFFFSKSRRLNAELSKREIELKRSNDVKDKLFSIIGHDLRGPIGNIPVMLQLLNDDNTSAEERNYLLDTLSEHSIASKETLDKLLYWGQSQIKGVGTRQAAFDTDAYVQNNMKLIKRSAAQKNINVINDVPLSTTIYADAAHFDFIIRNLLSNAVKFTHSGGTVTIGADKQMLPGFVVFMVKDTGIGIAADKIGDIFKSIGSSMRGTANEKGTSIGLMLCKEFVAENGGRIWVESEEGKGSAFYCSFKANA